MAVKQALDEALKDAMRSKNEAALASIRSLKSAMKLAEIDKKREFADEDVYALIQSAIKQRKDSIESFQTGGRQDLAAVEQAQIEVLARFLPAQMSEAEVAALVEQAVAATGAASAKEMGKVMGWLMPKVRGKADGSVVNALVKKKLGG